jgi:hypothetical protein
MKYLIEGDAMDSRVVYGSLPVLQGCVLLGKRSELSSAKGILLNVVDAPFDLPLVRRCTYSCRYKCDLVVLTEFGQLRVEFGVIIVRRLHGTLDPLRSVRTP